MYNKKIVSLEKREENKKKHTYGPNNARRTSFGLYLVIVAIQYPPSRVLHRLQPVIVVVVVVVRCRCCRVCCCLMVVDKEVQSHLL